MKYPVTPDGRYFVHHDRLWRCTNPGLDEAARRKLTRELMQVRRVVRDAKRAGDEAAIASARATVHSAKIALGERGPTWWDDDVDHNRKLIKKTPNADWYASVGGS